MISSDEHTNRTLRLLLPILAALIIMVLGAAVIVGMVVTAGAWWSLTSGLGLVAAGGVGTVAAVRRRRPSSSLPHTQPRERGNGLDG